MNKFITPFLSLLLLGLNVTTSSMTTQTDYPSQVTTIQYVLSGTEAQEYALSQQHEHYEDVEEVRVIYSIDPTMPISPASALDLGIHIHPGYNIQIQGGLIYKSIYQGEADATMSLSESLSISERCDVTVSDNRLKLAFGFDRTYTYTFTDTYSIHVPENTTYAIECYQYVDKYIFDIFNGYLFGEDYLGEGFISKPIGHIFYKVRVA